MWNIGVGPIELALFVLVLVSLAVFRGRLRRWIAMTLPFLALAIVLTPADPASALIVALPLIVAFSVGIFAASYVRPQEGVTG